MTVFSDTFDTATPVGATDNPAEADDRMREIKAATQERENVDHYWPLTGTEVSDVDTGEHRKVTLRTGSAPSNVANKGFVYAKDVGGKVELFFIDEDGNEIQITTAGKVIASLLSDGTVLESAAAPTTDPMVSNKKYIDDQIAAQFTAAGHVQADGSTVFNTTMTAANTFQDLDLSANVGSNVAWVYLEVFSDASIQYACKPKGEGSATFVKHTETGAEGGAGASASRIQFDEFRYYITQTDASGKIEHAATTGAANITIKLLGFIR